MQIRVQLSRRCTTRSGRADVLCSQSEPGPERLIELQGGGVSISATPMRQDIPRCCTPTRTDYGTFDIKLKRNYRAGSVSPSRLFGSDQTST